MVMGQHEISPPYLFGESSSVRLQTCYSEGQISVICIKLTLPEHVAHPV